MSPEPPLSVLSAPRPTTGAMFAPRICLLTAGAATLSPALLSAGSTVTARSPPASALAPIHGPYAPKIDPATSSPRIDNRYQPFPGTRFHFEGVCGTTPQTDDEVVLHRTRRILGVRSTVARDTVSEQGKAVEQESGVKAPSRG